MRSFVVSIIVATAATLLTRPAFAAEEKTEATPPAADAPILIVDLREKPPGIFHYATWQDKLGVTPNGIIIQGSAGARGDGGMGRNIEPALDLSAISYVEVALGVGAHNEVPEITLALNDADGTQVAARIRVDQIVPGQPVWLRVRRESFTRVSGQDGRDGKMDWTKVGQWHLQGDWTTKKPFHAVFIALRVRK